MTAISQSCVLTVRTPAQVCSLNVGSVLHWRDPVLWPRVALYKDPEVDSECMCMSVCVYVQVLVRLKYSEYFFNDDAHHNSNKTTFNILYAARCYVQHFCSNCVTECCCIFFRALLTLVHMFISVSDFTLEQ